MISVKNLIEHLKLYPKDAMVYAYDAEVVGIMIAPKPKDNNNRRDDWAFIPASEQYKPEEDQPPIKLRKRAGKKK